MTDNKKITVLSETVRVAQHLKEDYISLFDLFVDNIKPDRTPEDLLL